MFFQASMLFLLSFWLVISSPASAGATPPSTEPVPRILLFNSYNYGYDWSDQELAGFKARLEQTFATNDLYVENLDTKKFPHKEHFQQLFELYRHKYRSTSFDIVVTMDNAAFDFATRYRQQLFPDIPLVFCGLNDYRPAMLQGQTRITGVAELHETFDTLQLALQLQPAVREVVVIHDYTDTGLAMRHVLETEMKQLPGLRLRFLPEQPLEETLGQLNRLGNDQVVLILSYTVEKSGRAFTQAETARLLSQASPVPVYAVHLEQLGHGVVGGMMLSGTEQGELAAEAAIRILHGEDPAAIPIVTGNLARPIFDAQVMQQFGLKIASLPPATRLINLPSPFYHVDKKTFWLLVGVIAFLTLSLGAQLRTIRRRQRAETALRESEERFRLLMEQAPEAIFVYDVDQARMVDCNAKALKLFACSREKLLEAGPQQFYLEEQPDGLPVGESEKDHRSKALNGAHVQYQRAIATATGERLFCEVRLVHFPLKGRRLLRESFVNITDRINLESQLRQAEKMQAVGQLAGGVAHDFNNQLASILGYTEMLKNRLADEKLLLYVEYIKTAASRSADLTRQLLDFSRKGQQLLAPTRINDLLDEVVTILTRSIDKRIRLQQHLHAGPVKILCDPTQLQNALLNLALNARDAMPEGGELTFATDLVLLGEEFGRRHKYKIEPGQYLKVSVTDTGCGMDREVQKRIFEPFFTTKPIGKGTGMGLASVYGTVLGHHGHINAYSEPGQGTSFHLYLPVPREEPAETADKNHCQLPIRGTGRILVVDDEDLVRQMTVEILTDLGYSVSACGNGVEALKLYQESWQEFDLVVLDMNMPELDGRDTFLAMAKINPAVRAILCSGFSVDGNTQALLDLGIKAFVEKPFSSIDLSQKIAGVLT